MTLKLDENQQKAVEHCQRPALVVTDPGSGKITVIKERILHLIRECNVNPKQILVIAFTNAAVTELEERILGELNSNRGYPEIRTLHGFGKDIITENYARAEFSEFPVRWTEQIDEIIKQEPTRIEREASTTSVAIYKIESKSTGRCYIGQTTDPDRRRKQHFDCSSNDRLRQAIRFEGASQFSFEIIECVPGQLANCREAHWIRCYRNREGVFNRDDPLRVQYINQLILKMFCQHFEIRYKEHLDRDPNFENLRDRFNDLKETVMRAKRQVTVGLFDPTSVNDSVARAFAVKYETLRTEANAIDFEDMIIHAANLLETCPDLRQTYRDTYPYLLVDEFQDRSPIDFRLITLFSENLFAVGDLEYQRKKELQEISQKALETLKLKFKKEVEKECKAILKQSDELNHLRSNVTELKKASKQEEIDLPQQVKFTNDALLEGLIPVLDEFESQINSLLATTESNNESDDFGGLIGSVQLAYKQMLDTLKNYEFRPIETYGKIFNTAYHEEILPSIYSDEVRAGSVAREYRRGYLLHNQVIRKAQVVISKGENIREPERLERVVDIYLKRLIFAFQAKYKLSNVNQHLVKQEMVEYLLELNDESLWEIDSFSSKNKVEAIQLKRYADYCAGPEKIHRCTEVLRDFWNKIWEVIKFLDEDIKQADTLLSQNFTQPVRFVTYAGFRDLKSIETFKDGAKGFNSQDEEVELQNLNVLFAFSEDDMETLKSHIKKKPTIADQKLQPIKLISERFHVADHVLKSLIVKRDAIESDNQTSIVQLATRSGHVLNGLLWDFDEDFLYMNINKKIVIVYRAGILQFKGIWNEIAEAYKKVTTIKGYITKGIKGGLQVQFGSLNGFLPKSHVELKTVRNLDSYVGKTLKMKVIKLSRTNNSVVFSRHVWLEERKSKLLNKPEEVQHEQVR